MVQVHWIPQNVGTGESYNTGVGLTMNETYYIRYKNTLIGGYPDHLTTGKKCKFMGYDDFNVDTLGSQNGLVRTITTQNFTTVLILKILFIGHDA